MATQPNPFQAGFNHRRGQTLIELEAASNGMSTSRGQLRRFGGGKKVREWLFDQETSRGSGGFTELDEPDTPPSHLPASIMGSYDERAGWQSPSRFAGALPTTHSSSTNMLKRKASHLDEQEEDVIVFKPLSHTTRRGLDSTDIVDLTRDSRQRRKTSFMGHQDDDVIIIDPPAADVRRDLRELCLGIHDMPTEPPVAEVIHNSQQLVVRTRNNPVARPRNRNRSRRTRVESRPASFNRRAPENAQTATPGANAAEVSNVLNSVEPVAHFFTLATEIRDKIYRHLLVSPKPISVKCLWTEAVRRFSRRGDSIDVDDSIDPKILFACRQTAMEGTRILYSENVFLYLLRDSECIASSTNSGSGGGRNTRNTRGSSAHTINLARYGHLIRHMAIELEPNRTEASYQELMTKALEALVPSSAALGSPSRSFCDSIHLHTLTITVSPLLEPNQRTVRSAGAGNQDITIQDGRYLSVVGVFSRSARVIRALQNINTNFLRINVHVNSNLRGTLINPRRRRPEPSTPDLEVEDNSDDDDDALSSITPSSDSSSHARRPRRPRPWHFETTLDLRYLPRHMEALGREATLGNIWGNDTLVQERRRKKGEEVERALRNMRVHIEQACLEPEAAIKGGFWEEHGAAERRRREEKARNEAKFDRDAYDDDDEGDEEDRRPRWPTKSLIISIDRVGGELRAYRA
ncbi:hypothetical protein MFIFM68171_05170 [Madurella fahalii]|uniref:Uncharacterized protein n=1 Tax=Madurella fahalii TaxID=1157608 RepID=A0ABQ0GB35_9PEZI